MKRFLDPSNTEASSGSSFDAVSSYELNLSIVSRKPEFAVR